jgi:chaperonin GroEL (HSP60 family)
MTRDPKQALHMLEDIGILTAGTMVSADLGIKLEKMQARMARS